MYAVGLNKNDEGKAELVLGLKADSKAALDPTLTTPELSKLFEDAKKAAGKTAEPVKSGGDGSYPAPPESQVNTPLPLYVEPPEDAAVAKVTLRYKPFGGTQYKSVDMKKMGKGYGVEIPCDEVTTTGDIKYYFAFTGTDGDTAGSLGTPKDPFKTKIKNELDGDAPKLPGKKPPEQCKDKGDCPPGLPGCESKGKHGDKGWGAACEQSSECKEGLSCPNGTCEEGGGDTPPEEKKRMNLISVGAEFDFLVLNSAQNVCSGANAAYVCFLSGSSNQYGVPVTMGAAGSVSGNPLNLPNTDGIAGGGAFAGARILVGYERQFVKKLGFTGGVRVGYAFGGPSSPSNSSSIESPAKAFLPVHVEGRISYYLFNSMMEPKKLRPYGFVAGGFAQVNASVPVALCDGQPAATPGINCGSNTAGQGIVRQVSAYQLTGLSFAGFGLGTTLGITPVFGLSAELKFMFLVPTFGVAVSPTISPVFNF